MFQQLIVNKATAAIDLFAQCVKAEMDAADFPKKDRQQLAVLFDNAMLRYQQARNDANTKAIITAMRPRLKAWLLS